ncbi:hypothetical protein [Enterovirga sp.]|jgi:SAM-dependent methyltransferase|uniref:class I SAM-dependent methyltransferase n=1 Tax=Enterovirga sp. TaxID=2026350 RepID=UPI002633EC6F|nr:hypothetical protein [Enterovirga sp.]MDB5591585.1 hypothetical protein [Enterovirga sp.]
MSSDAERSASALYDTPRHVEGPEGCHFYHATDLPGIGSVPGDWDLRATVGDYLGNVPFAGKRVLDIGSASGFLSFEAERRGGEVVSYDLSPTDRWDAVPHSGVDLGSVDGMMREHLDSINRAYWLSHRLNGSRARLARGTVYAIPDAVGPVDVAIFGAILLHLRDPFRALHSGLRLTRETVVVTDLLPGRYRWLRHVGRYLGAPMFFVPRSTRKERFDTWWIIPPETVCEMLRVLGFEDLRVAYHLHPFRGSPRLTYTVVGRRTGPASDRI